jgi:hypothetical protein
MLAMVLAGWTLLLLCFGNNAAITTAIAGVDSMSSDIHSGSFYVDLASVPPNTCQASADFATRLRIMYTLSPKR